MRVPYLRLDFRCRNLWRIHRLAVSWKYCLHAATKSHMNRQMIVRLSIHLFRNEIIFWFFYLSENHRATKILALWHSSSVCKISQFEPLCCYITSDWLMSSSNIKSLHNQTQKKYSINQNANNYPIPKFLKL